MFLCCSPLPRELGIRKWCTLARKGVVFAELVQKRNGAKLVPVVSLGRDAARLGDPLDNLHLGVDSIQSAVQANESLVFAD